MKVLFAASEIFPYAKTGGLADVAHSLPLALKEDTHISRVMPLYGFMDEKKFTLYDNFTVTLDGKHYGIKTYFIEENGIITYFIQAPHLSQTQHPYGNELGDYNDNALRFALFCMAIIELAIRLGIELIHLNDWHTALVALYIHEYRLKLKTVFTIHNLAYQGVFEKTLLHKLGICEQYFTMDGVEFYGKVNFLKAGIAYSDAITTVSYHYAQEILTPQFGCGLEGFLGLHKQKLTGILNGIDYAMNTPLKNLAEKQKIKTVFCEKFHFTDPKLPLFVMVSRLVEQKGVDLILASFKELHSKKINLFILGEGEEQYTKILHHHAKQYSNFHFFQGYDEALSQRTYLAADFLLMPSTFEPCGLNQFIAMKSGTVALVHAVGGLAESVHEGKKVCGQGIVYTEQNKKEFLFAIERALRLYKNSKAMKDVIAFNLQCDFSFEKSAKKYLQIYRSLLCS